MIKLSDCFDAIPLEHSAIDVINKLIFNPRKAYSTSTDEATYYQFGGKILTRIHRILEHVHKHTYKFKPCKKIQKRTKDKIRDIYLSCWDDKIVETWLNDSLNMLLTGWFSKHAYAYRIGELGLDACQDRITKVVQFCKYFVKRDVSQYFYSIDHELLLNQLGELIDKNDYLFQLVSARVKFDYCDKDSKEVKKATIGVPFGSPISCTLSNIFLTNVDKLMRQFKVYYFRYADDILIAGTDPEEVIRASKCFDDTIVSLKLKLKASHSINFAFVDHPDFKRVSKFKHLGLEYLDDGRIKLGVEKQRKIINFFKRELDKRKYQIRRAKGDEKIKIAVEAVNDMVVNRIRSAAIVDYYLKHVNDEVQLRNMDRLVAERVISTVLEKKPFLKSFFREIPFKKLRKMGLLSLVHRNRLHRHGKLKISFLSLHNELVMKRYIEQMERRKERIEHMRMSRKIRGKPVKKLSAKI